MTKKLLLSGAVCTIGLMCTTSIHASYNPPNNCEEILNSARAHMRAYEDTHWRSTAEREESAAINSIIDYLRCLPK